VKCPNCSSIEVEKRNFVWSEVAGDGSVTGKSVLQLTIRCKSCGFGGVYPQFCEEGEVGKWG
jgi:predicted Zn-ribbon and HTH transcriptional regulator